MEEFGRIKRLPPYVFNVINEMKGAARRRGEDIVDLGMGNPDLPTPPHIVEKLVEAARNPRNHRYSASSGIFKLREAICEWYARRFGVELDPNTEAVVTIGAKEGIGHLVLACVEPGDLVLVPNPTYPIHTYSVVIAGGDLFGVPICWGGDFLEALSTTVKLTWPRPKMVIVNFPHNPTTMVADLEFFGKLVAFARENNLMLVHDLAYADLVFDGYKAPSLLQVPGAKEVGVECFSLSKSYSMPGWRVGFMVGNQKMVANLTRLKSYMDYGIFQPIQIAAIVALRSPDAVTMEIADIYRQRRDALIQGLAKAGWQVPKPKATMFVWGEIPEPFRVMGSVEFAKLLLTEGKVAVSPGIGFGQYGEGYVRFALVENEMRIRQAVRGIRAVIAGNERD